MDRAVVFSAFHFSLHTTHYIVPGWSLKAFDVIISGSSFKVFFLDLNLQLLDPSFGLS